MSTAWPRRASRSNQLRVPVARLEDLLELAEERRRVGAVEGAVVEALADLADRAHRDRIAARALDHDGPLAHRIGRQDRDLRDVDDGRREHGAEGAVVRDRVGAALEVTGAELAGARLLDQAR